MLEDVEEQVMIESFTGSRGLRNNMNMAMKKV